MARGFADLTIARAVDQAVRKHREVVRVREADAPRMGLWEWSQLVPEAKSGTLDFDAYPFQRELYALDPWDRETVIQKSTQLGISAWLMRWGMWLADVERFTVLYVFPRKAQSSRRRSGNVRPSRKRKRCCHPVRG